MSVHVCPRCGDPAETPQETAPVADDSALTTILARHAKWLHGEDGGERADLSGADLSGADLSDAVLSGAVLSRAVLRDADLRDADLRDADLRDAVLSGAVLRDAVLRDADLSGADLRDADLSGADLRDADLSRAGLWGVVGDRRFIRSMQVDRYAVAWTSDRLQIGCKNYLIDAWWAFEDDEIAVMDCGALRWWRKAKPLLQALIAAYPAEPTGAEGGDDA